MIPKNRLQLANGDLCQLLAALVGEVEVDAFSAVIASYSFGFSPSSRYRYCSSIAWALLSACSQLRVPADFLNCLPS